MLKLHVQPLWGLVMRGLLFIGCLGVVSAVASAPALAQTEAVAVDVRAEVAAALYAASATQAAAERAGDARLRTAQAEITRLQAEGLRARAALTAAQERFVAELAGRDRAFAQEISELRSAATDIASTPEGAAALARFNAGDENGALLALDRLADARERARQVRANIETAAERRRVSRLALDAWARGRLDTQSVISRYLQLVSLDPENARDWIQLSRLHQHASNFSAAADAARRAVAAARTNDEEENIARANLGTVLQNLGDLENARTQFEIVLDAYRRRLQLKPSSPEAQSDVSLALSLLAGILVRQGEHDAASSALAEARQLADQARAATPASVANWRSQAIALAEQADFVRARGDLAAARRQLEEAVSIFRQLAAVQPDLREARRDLALTLVYLGDTLVIDRSNASGASLEALRIYEEALRLFQELAQSDPTNGQAQGDLAAVLTKMGDALYVLGDFSNALARYQEGLDTDLALLSADPANAELRRSLSVDYEKLAMVEAERGNWEEATRHQENAVEVMRQLASIAPANPQFRNELQAAERTLQGYRARRAPTRIK